MIIVFNRLKEQRHVSFYPLRAPYCHDSNPSGFRFPLHVLGSINDTAEPKYELSIGTVPIKPRSTTQKK